MNIQVFIENEAGSDQKNLFDEKTLEYEKTVKVSRPYPYPYGFIPNTKSGDGDSLDCLVITKQPLKSRQLVEVEPIGMVEQFEDGQTDHKIIAVLPGETVELTEAIKQEWTNFVLHVFDHKRTKEIQVGQFYGLEAAENLIAKSKI